MDGVIILISVVAIVCLVAVYIGYLRGKIQALEEIAQVNEPVIRSKVGINIYPKKEDGNNGNS